MIATPKLIGGTLILFHRIIMSSSSGWTSENLSSHSTLFAISPVKKKPVEMESTKPSTTAKSTEESTMKSESKKKKFYVGMKRESVASNSDSNIESKKRGKTMKSQTTEAEDTLENAIEDVDNVNEARRIQQKLHVLKKKADAKVHTFEKSAEKDGLSYKGKDAVKCPGSDCDNSFDPEGEYNGGVCTGCDEQEPNNDTMYCIECIEKCECGEEYWCSKCRKECKVCEEKIICKECDIATECEHCRELVCEDCTREVGNHMHTMVWCIECEGQTRSRW